MVQSVGDGIGSRMSLITMKAKIMQPNQAKDVFDHLYAISPIIISTVALVFSIYGMRVSSSSVKKQSSMQASIKRYEHLSEIQKTFDQLSKPALDSFGFDAVCCDIDKMLLSTDEVYSDTQSLLSLALPLLSVNTAILLKDKSEFVESQKNELRAQLKKIPSDKETVGVTEFLKSMVSFLVAFDKALKDELEKTSEIWNNY